MNTTVNSTVMSMINQRPGMGGLNGTVNHDDQSSMRLMSAISAIPHSNHEDDDTTSSFMLSTHTQPVNNRFFQQTVDEEQKAAINRNSEEATEILSLNFQKRPQRANMPATADNLDFYQMMVQQDAAHIREDITSA